MTTQTTTEATMNEPAEELQETEVEKSARENWEEAYQLLLDKFPGYVATVGEHKLRNMSHPQLTNQYIKLQHPIDKSEAQRSRIKNLIHSENYTGKFGSWTASDGDLEPWLNALWDGGWDIKWVMPSFTGGRYRIIGTRRPTKGRPAKEN